MTLNEAIAALKNGTVTKLNLTRCRIDDAGAIALAEVLATNTTLETLDLSNNPFGDAGAAAIAEVLKTNKTLKELNLLYSRIRNTGVTALATALETNATLTSLDLPFNQPWMSEPVSTVNFARVETLLARNRLFKQLAILKQQLAAEVTYQADDPTQKYSAADTSRQLYFNVTQLFDTLADLHQKIKHWAASESPRRAEDIKKLRNDWLALVVQFHLRCVDTPNDTRPITNIHPQVAWAEQCLAQMNVDSEGYKEACYQLGRYYVQRATKCFDAEDNDQGRAFAKTALNYLHVCKQEPNFKEAETRGLIYDDSDLPILITVMVNNVLSSDVEFSVKAMVKETEESVQSKEARKDFTIYMPDKENYDRALNLEVPDAKTVPAKINYNEAAIFASLKNTVKAAEKTAAFYHQLKQTEKADPAAALDSLLKLLDQELLNANNRAEQHTSLLSTVSGFFKMRVQTPQQIASSQARALQAVKDALTGNRTEGNFADHVAVLKNTAVGEQLAVFIVAGHAKVGNKQVATFEEFVEEVMKKNILTPEQG